MADERIDLAVAKHVIAEAARKGWREVSCPIPTLSALVAAVEAAQLCTEYMGPHASPLTVWTDLLKALAPFTPPEARHG